MPTLAPREKLKAGLLTGQALQVSADDELKITRSDDVSTLSGGVLYGNQDPHVRTLGGRREVGISFPRSFFTFGTAITFSDALKSSNVSILEFIPSVSSIELFTIDNVPTDMLVQISGVANRYSYKLGNGTTGGLRYVRVDLPTSAIGQRIRLTMNNAGYGGIVVASGGTLADSALPNAPAVVFIGDSITEGTGATEIWYSWPMQAAYRLGIDNPIISAIGASGYLAAANPGHGGPRDNTFRERINDVLQAVNGRPPDAVFIAGGINDNGRSADEVGAEAFRYFQELRAGAPDMAIFVVTPFTQYQDPGGIASVNLLRDAIVAAAARVSGTYVIDVTPIVTVQNRGAIFYSPGDPHPTDFGHAAYGQFIADTAAQYIRGF